MSLFLLNPSIIFPRKLNICLFYFIVQLYYSRAIYSIIAILLVLGTCYDSFYRGDQKNNFLVSFSVLSNAEKLFQVSNEKKKSNIDCLNGIRVLSMMWVIYGHTFASNSAVPKINFIDYNKVSYQTHILHKSAH